PMPACARGHTVGCMSISRQAKTWGRAIVLVVAVGLALPVGSSAWRRPTSGEAAAIKAAALRTLHGGGWRAHAVRLSTVRSTYRYATASVDNNRTEAGGEPVREWLKSFRRKIAS
ncbi:MAG: hypothetical protein ACXVZT_13560, partial [Terriglobales bacterium]